MIEAPHRARRRAAGLCLRCGITAVFDKVTCTDCVARAVADKQQRHGFRKSAGVCVSCDNPAVLGRTKCSTHLKANSTYTAKNTKKRAERDLDFRMRKLLRGRLGNILMGKSKSGSSVRDLGCTIPELLAYIESLWQPGMTWDNWSLHGWHIDHIQPLSCFDLTDKNQLLKACHYTNLQPMWAGENWSKNSRLGWGQKS